MPNETLYQRQVKGADIITIAATPTLTTHAGYAANDFVGEDHVAMTFTDCARIDGGGGIIARAHVEDYAAQSVSGELWLFDSNPTPPDDSAAWTITDADLDRLICVIPISTYYASAVNSVGQSDTLSFTFKCASGDRDLYGCFVTRGAPAYADGDLTFVLHIIQA